MMGNSKTIKLCGIDYRILTVQEEMQHDSVMLGQIDYKAAEIKLCNDMNAQVERQVLWHEVIHGLLSGIGRDDLSSDETFVQALATEINQCAVLKLYTDPLLKYDEQKRKAEETNRKYHPLPFEDTDELDEYDEGYCD